MRMCHFVVVVVIRLGPTCFIVKPDLQKSVVQNKSCSLKAYNYRAIIN